MKKLSKNKLESTCVYCGKYDVSSTREHPIPRCFFGKFEPLPSNLVTIPACYSCNNQKSSDDNYFRDVFCTTLAAENNRVAKAIVEGEFRRATKCNRSELARSINRSIEVPVFTPNNIYLGNYHANSINGLRLSNFLFRIIQAMYWINSHKTIPHDIHTAMILIPIEAAINIVKEHNFSTISIGSKREMVSEVFTARFRSTDDDHNSALWILSFYQSIHFGVNISPKTNGMTKDVILL